MNAVLRAVLQQSSVLLQCTVMVTALEVDAA